MRNNLFLLLLLLIAQFIMGCRSTHRATPLPITYSRLDDLTIPLTDDNNEVYASSALPAAVAVPQPSVKANLGVTSPPLPAQIQKSRIDADVAQLWPKRAYLVAMPDTSTAHPKHNPTPREVQTANRRNIALHIFGALLVAVGVAMVIAGVASTGLSLVIGLYCGGTVAAIGGALLLFKSRYSTKYQQREARRTAHRA